jgi:hypothetical protein
MQEKRQQMKIPSAWTLDKWVCHHSGNRQSDGLSLMGSRNFASPSSPKRISTAKLKRRKFLHKNIKYFFFQ